MFNTEQTLYSLIPFFSGGTLTVIALENTDTKKKVRCLQTNQYFLAILCWWKSWAIHCAAALCLVRINTPDVALRTNINQCLRRCKSITCQVCVLVLAVALARTASDAYNVRGHYTTWVQHAQRVLKVCSPQWYHLGHKHDCSNAAHMRTTSPSLYSTIWLACIWSRWRKIFVLSDEPVFFRTATPLALYMQHCYKNWIVTYFLVHIA